MATSKVDIGAYKARFGKRYGAFKRGVLLKLFAAVIRDTPVDTGRLRGNWRFSKGSPDPSSDVTQTTDPTSIINTKIATAVTDKDENYYLTNNLPYANRIEYEGWSRRKAPQGMVRKNVVRIAALLQAQAASSNP